LLHQNYGLLPYVHNLLVGRMVVFWSHDHMIQGYQ
jgi:hypothetical protein